MATSTYDASFYEVAREGAKRSAAVIVPLVLQHIPAKTVLDVGCGEGWFAKAFRDAGCLVTGLDGSGGENVLEQDFIERDLTEELPGGEWDLTVSLEVAEHLPESRADSFIAELCASAPVILFSAAIPGQGGTNHVNEQWPAYWTERFHRNGFACSGALRWMIWNDDRVENWYRQNLIVAAKAPGRLPALFATPTAEVFPVVHPVLYDARR